MKAIKATIIRWQGGYGHVEGALPGSTLEWQGHGIEIYVSPGIMADGMNIIRGEAIQVCKHYKIRAATLRKVMQ